MELFKKHRFAIPEALFPGPKDSLGIYGKREILTIEGFDVSCVIIETRFPDVHSRALAFMEGPPLHIDRSRIKQFSAKDGSIQVYSASRLEASEVKIPRDSENPDRWRAATAAYEEVLRKVSARTGCLFTFHAGPSFTEDPLPDKPNEYHVFAHCAPSGETEQYKLGRIFGVHLGEWSREYTALRNICRGYTVWDETQKPAKAIAQIIGHNIFTLAPCMGVFNSSSSGIFELQMLESWKHIQKGQAPGVLNPATSDDCIEQIHAWLDDEPGQLGDLISEKMQEIARLESKLRDLKIEINRINRIRQGISIANTEHKKSIVSEGVLLILADPRVDRVERIGNGLTVFTKPIISEYEGERYQLGSFAIRMNKNNQLFVWCEKSEHHNNVAHPHFTNGVPCFGNAARPIDEAVSEFRWADMVQFVLEWLQYGYEDSNALVKIEEWPVLVDEMEPLTERVLENGVLEVR